MASIQEYYDILDISPNATLKEIKKAYRQKGREYANDKDKMILLNQAYEFFCNPERAEMPIEDTIDEQLREKINSIKEKSRNSKTIEERNQYLQEARQIYLEILSTNPQNTEALWNLSTIEELLENYETSISYLRQLEQKVVRKDDKLEVYHRLGELYKKLGEIDEAIKCFYVIYKEDATYADDIKALVRLSYEEKKNIKIAIQVLNDCINRCSEIRLKILYLCETLRAIRMLKNASYQKVEDTLYKKLETFHTEDVQANDTNMAELVEYMQDAINRKDFEVFHRLEKIYESYYVKNNALNHTCKGMKQIVAIMEKGKFHKAIDLYFSEVWTKEIREQLGEWVIREAAEIKESLECIKREAPIYWKEWEEDLLDLEKAVNNNFNVSKEFRTLLKDRTMSYSLKKLVEYLLLDGFVKFEDIEDAFVKESDAFFEMEDKEKVEHNLRKMEEVYPICYAIFSDVFLKDTNTQKATNSNANPTSSTQQASQKSKTQLKENLKNPALLKNVLYRAIGWYVCLGISETLLNNEEGIWGIVGLLFGLVAYLFGAGAIYHFVEYYKPSKINEEQRIKLDKRKKWVKRLLKLGFAIWVVIFLIGTASEVITSIKQNIEFKKEEEYKAEHNYLLTDKELEKRDKLNKKYDALTEVMIRFKQIDDEVDVEETNYVEEAEYILLEFTDYGYKGNIALTSNYLTNEEKELLWEAVQVVYDGEDTDYEKCEQFYELAYKLVKTKEESMVTVPNLLGMTESQAQKVLLKSDLYFSISEYAYSSNYKKDCIMWQSVTAGEKISKGSTVYVDMSLGEDYTINYDNCLTEEELRKQEELNVEYSQKAGVDIRVLQVKEDYKVSYPTDPNASYVWLIIRTYDDINRWELSVNGLDKKNILAKELHEIRNSNVTDYEKCEQFYESAYNFVTNINSTSYMVFELDMNTIWQAMKYNYSIYEFAETVKSNAVNGTDYKVDQYNKSATLHLVGNQDTMYGDFYYNEYYGAEQANTFEWKISKQLTVKDIENMFQVSLTDGGDIDGWANFSWYDNMYLNVGFNNDSTGFYFSIYEYQD